MAMGISLSRSALDLERDRPERKGA